MAAADHASAVRPRSYQDESYQHGFFGTVGDLKKSEVLRDVVLEVEGRRFPCHRDVLSEASPYFRDMFSSGMAESRQKTVVLQDLDAVMFDEILSYIYSGTLHVSLDKVQPLYQAADLLQLDYVRDTCSSYMAMNVDCSTCVDLYKFADVFSVDIVLNRCLQWMYKNFAEVASSKEFCSLSVDQLTEIISHDELDVKEETTVWEAVVRWVQHSREDRQCHLPSILPHIRFNLLTSDDTEAILDHPLVREDPESSEVIRNVVQTGNLKPRLGVAMDMVMLSSMGSGSKELLFMNPQEGKYISCSYELEDKPNFSAITVTSDNNIYILKDKESGDKKQQSLFKYNHSKNVWENAGMSPISRGLKDDSKPYEDLLFEVDQVFYHIAVDRDYSPLVRMRKYNEHTGQWQEGPQLQVDEDSYETGVAVSCGSHLYFLTMSEMHRYDPSQDRWCKCTPQKIISEVHTAVAMGTEIFCTDLYFSQTMVYDTEEDSWQKLQGWPNSPNGLIKDLMTCLFVLDNQLHALLNYTSGSKEEVYLVFVYDRSTDAWRDLKATLPSKKYYVHGPQCPVARMHLRYLKGA